MLNRAAAFPAEICTLSRPLAFGSATVIPSGEDRLPMPAITVSVAGAWMSIWPVMGQIYTTSTHN
jgi:hypothetical protein